MTLRSPRVLLFAASLACLGAHASNQAPLPTSGAQETASITIYRAKTFVGSLVGHKVTVNGAFAGKLRPGTYTVVDVPAGNHTVCIFGGRLCAEPIAAEPGKSYFIVDTSDATNKGGGGHEFSIYLVQVAKADVPEEFSGYKLVEAKPLPATEQ